MALKENVEWLITYTRAGIENTLARWFDHATPPTEKGAVWEVLKVVGESFYVLPPKHRGIKYTLPQELALHGAVVTSIARASAR